MLRSYTWSSEFAPDLRAVTPELPNKFGAAMVVAVLPADQGTSSPTDGNPNIGGALKGMQLWNVAREEVQGGGRSPRDDEHTASSKKEMVSTLLPESRCTAHR